MFIVSNISFILSWLSCMYFILENSFRFFFAASKASSSLSIPINIPCSDSFFAISLLCPAPPNVPSTYLPSGFIFSPCIHSSSLTGLCLISHFLLLAVVCGFLSKFNWYVARTGQLNCFICFIFWFLFNLK